MINETLQLIKFVRDEYNINPDQFNLSKGLCSTSSEEYVACVELLKKENITDGFIEIGSAWGASFHLWASIIPGIKISIDMIYDELAVWDHRNAIWNNHFDDVYSLYGNSHEQGTVDKVAELLKGQQVGFLYIDGDHRYEGCNADYQMYKHFVKPGGWIGIHDVLCNHEPAVKRWWNDFKPTYDGTIIECPSIEGIGMIQV